MKKLHNSIVHYVSDKLSNTSLLRYAIAYLIMCFSFASSALAQNTYVTTSCGYMVTTQVLYNSPTAGKSTFIWTVQNTNPGNGKNGTFKDLSHLSQKLGTCVDPANRDAGGTYGPDPSQNCLTGDQLKFNTGTTGSTPTVYVAVFSSLDYAPILVDASFKAGNGCCSGQIYGVGCCVINPGAVNGGQTVCTGENPGILGSTTDATGNGTISYQWQSNTTGCGGSFADITGANAATYDPPAGITQTTYYHRVATSAMGNGGPSCSDNSNCVVVTVNPGGTLLGSSVAGSIKFCGGSVNYFNSSNGYVPAGCSNSGLGSTTVAIVNPGNEFCFLDGANQDNANFTGNALTLTDVSVAGGCPFIATFNMYPGLVTSVTKQSDNFTNGGASFTFVNDVLTINVPGFNVGGNFAAVFSFTVNCNINAKSSVANTIAVQEEEVTTGNISNGRKTPPSMLTNDLRIYPNPNNGVMTLQLPSYENQAQIVITNVMGQIIFKKDVSQKDGTMINLDLGNVSRGLYFVQVSYGAQHSMARMVVE